MELFFLELAQKHPALLSVLSFLYILSAINKPLFTLLHNYASATETKADDELVEKVEASKLYKGFVYVLDWVVRVKLPVKK